MAQAWWIGIAARFRGAVWPRLLFLCLGPAAACTSSDGGDTEPQFPTSFFSGGAPAIVQPTLVAGSGTAAGAAAATIAGGGGVAGSGVADACADVPEGQLALIDDFEDHDQDAVPEPEREAFWFPLKDDPASAGVLVPDSVFPGGVPGGAHGSPQAAHVTASGFTVWGAAFAANISHLKDGIRCPFNARHFSGYRFYARGSGRVYVLLQIPDIVDEQYGGTCRPSAGDVCYDAHGTWITLTADWQTYSFKWSDFKQRGFGKQAPFNPGTIMSLQFSFEKDQLPVDVWLDDVSWDDGSPFPAAGTAGSAGASASEIAGSGGLGGSGGLAGSGGLGEVSGLAGASGRSTTSSGGSGGQRDSGVGGTGQGNP